MIYREENGQAKRCFCGSVNHSRDEHVDRVRRGIKDVAPEQERARVLRMRRAILLRKACV